MPWFALWVDGGRELAVSDQLRARAIETFTPYTRARRWEHGKRVWRKKALFTGYAFIALHDPQWLRPTTWGIIGVRNLVRFDSQAPAAIPDPVMRALFARVDDEDGIALASVIPGRSYRIRGNHALRGLIAMIDSVAGEECKAWVELLGKRHLIHLNAADLEDVAE